MHLASIITLHHNINWLPRYAFLTDLRLILFCIQPRMKGLCLTTLIADQNEMLLTERLAYNYVTAKYNLKARIGFLGKGSSKKVGLPPK